MFVHEKGGGVRAAGGKSVMRRELHVLEPIEESIANVLIFMGIKSIEKIEMSKRKNLGMQQEHQLSSKP